MRLHHVMGIVLSAVSAVAPTVGWAAGKANPDAGKKLYTESCVHCHGAKGDGKTEMAAYLTPAPADLSSKAVQAKPDAVLQKTIVEGRAGTAMTGFGNYSAEQLADLLAYLRTLKP